MVNLSRYACGEKCWRPCQVALGLLRSVNHSSSPSRRPEVDWGGFALNANHIGWVFESQRTEASHLSPAVALYSSWPVCLSAQGFYLTKLLAHRPLHEHESPIVDISIPVRTRIPWRFAVFSLSFAMNYIAGGSLLIRSLTCVTVNI